MDKNVIDNKGYFFKGNVKYELVVFQSPVGILLIGVYLLDQIAVSPWLPPLISMSFSLP